jgi:hypothetical protein
LPDSQAGNFRNLELRAFLASDNEEGDSADQRQPTEDRRDGNMLLLVRGGVDGPEIENCFPTGIIEALIGEGQPTQNN